jgi:predicted RNA-binding protein
VAHLEAVAKTEEGDVWGVWEGGEGVYLWDVIGSDRVKEGNGRVGICGVGNGV